MSIDVQCISDFLPTLHWFWSAPLQAVIAIVSLYFSMGISIFAGVGIMFAMIPLHAYLGGWTRALQVKQMMFKDSRTKIINEVLHGIKVCHYFFLIKACYSHNLWLLLYYRWSSCTFGRFLSREWSLAFGEKNWTKFRKRPTWNRSCFSFGSALLSW